MKYIISLLLTISVTTLLQAQNVGIGTNIPLSKFAVKGAGANPTIPGATSTGVFRIAIGDFEAIDIGKMSASPNSAWVQAGYDGQVTDPLSLQPLGGNVGIGTLSPVNKLTVSANADVSGTMGIGISTPALFAMPDVSSTTRGFLPPRMDSNGRNAIVLPSAGLMLYHTSIKAFQCYNGNAWYSTVHYIGERYGGGIVFYVYDNGQHGSIGATADQSTGIRWCGGTNTSTRARADGVGGGFKNTALIIANQSAVDNLSSAATVCNKYSVLDANVTYGDW